MKNIDFYREKAADILRKMTLDEKIAQMNLYIIDDLYNKIVISIHYNFLIEGKFSHVLGLRLFETTLLLF